MTSRAYKMGIRGRDRKACKDAGMHACFIDRTGAEWMVRCDSEGYFYARLDGIQVTDTSYGYAFSAQAALVKALAELQA
ncbi:MAG: hypothetical protein DDT20_00840 [Firmicutes bacterium]|nr:hypothetical protein [Bacillota bacterium]